MKTKVTFKLDLEKDIHNVWETANSNLTYGYDFKKHIHKKTLSICRGKKFEECKKELAKGATKIYSNKLIPILIKAVNDSWKTINDEYFRRLEKITKTKMYRNSFTGYLTFAGRCPYNTKEHYFYFSYFEPFARIMEIAAHEIMHLQFHNTYWNKVEKKIGKKKTGDLKEALTVLLNLEFRDLWFVEDRGYQMHKELREFISQEWKKDKDFEKLIEKCVEYLK
jgi:hypothetical protein